MNEMTIEQLEERSAAIDAMNLDGMDTEAVEKLAEERDALHAELETRKKLAAEAAEKRMKVAADTKLEVKADLKEKREDKTMSLAEIRNSAEYGAAYIRALKGDDTEARALLSGNVSGGQIPVPTML